MNRGCSLETRGGLSTSRLRHRSSPVYFRSYKMAQLQKLTKKYYHFARVSPQFREFGETRDILKIKIKINPRRTHLDTFFKIDFSKKIEKKFQKNFFFSKTKSFHKKLLRALNHLTISHFSAKFEPNRGPTVRTLPIGMPPYRRMYPHR